MEVFSSLPDNASHILPSVLVPVSDRQKIPRRIHQVEFEQHTIKSLFREFSLSHRRCHEVDVGRIMEANLHACTIDGDMGGNSEVGGAWF